MQYPPEGWERKIPIPGNEASMSANPKLCLVDAGAFLLAFKTHSSGQRTNPMPIERADPVTRITTT